MLTDAEVLWLLTKAIRRRDLWLWWSLLPEPPDSRDSQIWDQKHKRKNINNIVKLIASRFHPDEEKSLLLLCDIKSRCYKSSCEWSFSLWTLCPSGGERWRTLKWNQYDVWEWKTRRLSLSFSQTDIFTLQTFSFCWFLFRRSRVCQETDERF